MNNKEESWAWGEVPPEEKSKPEEPKKEENRGAPKGKGHVYPDNEDVKTGNSYLKRKAEGKALFLSGFSLKTISKQIDVPASVINKWAEDEQWRPERDEQLNQTTLERIDQMRASQEITIAHLDEMKKTAIDAIKDKKVFPKKFSESVNSYIQAEETQRKIKIEAVQIQFLLEVAKVLREEIIDQELLKRIGERLSKLYRQEQLNSVHEGKLLTQAPEEEEDAPTTE